MSATSDEEPTRKKRLQRFKARPGYTIAAFQFALDPNAQTERRLWSHTGAARAAYNWAVSYVLAAWWQRKAEESYGMAEPDLTPWRSWSLPSLRKTFNQIKRTDPRFAGWWEENSKEAYNTGFANAAAAFDNYAKSKNGTRKGPKMGIPKRKRKATATPACRFTTGTIRLETDRKHVVLPVIGRVKTHESTRKLEQHLTNGTARILSATVKHLRGRWFVSFQVEIRRGERKASQPDTAVGVDLGVKHLAVMADSTGEIRYEPNPKHLDAALRLLRKAARRLARRQGPTVYDPATGRKAKRTPSAGWLEAKQQLARLHHRVANLRADGIHQLTRRLTREYGHVVVEDLNVAGMLKNPKIARRIADAGFGEIRRQLVYKAGWAGGTVHIADRWYPSSKTCSTCGAAKAKLPLHVRVLCCDNCGLIMDRDENAARNLAALAAAGMTGTAVGGDRSAQSAEGPWNRPEDSPPPPSRETGPGGRAGGAIPAQCGKEAGHRRQATEALTLW
ncbi:IS607 family element RNA-guided endonuclease TnpB [Nonomuraea sp. 10N515B]|uniref:IS607 family element RNA-guided endonuclease TnpB n=1 Tax=Nonomuraea sp. 10N515B TaxID=3457422 RepID=UPI003FCDA2DC